MVIPSGVVLHQEMVKVVVFREHLTVAILLVVILIIFQISVMEFYLK